MVKNSKTIYLSTANALTADKYTTVTKKGSNLTVRLSGSSKDSDGDIIADGNYKVYVLTVADGTNANLNALSASIPVTLDNTPLVTPVATVVGAADSYVNSTKKAAGFDVVAKRNKANSTLYVVPSGTASTATAITAASIGSMEVTAANANTTIQIPLNSVKVIDGTSYVVYAVDSAEAISSQFQHLQRI